MEKSKNRLPLKVLLSYLALAALVVIVGMIVSKEISSFTKAQKDDTQEKNKILRIGKLLTLMYESESFARAAIQSNNQTPYINFLSKNDSIAIQIDSLKLLINEPYQSKLLDSVNLLLNQKIKNINELRELRINDKSEKSLDTAIERLASIEEKLGRLTLKDYVEEPDSLDPKTREILLEINSIYNRYIPRDSSNTVDQHTLDSIVSASREMLQNVKESAASQKTSLDAKERQLLRNDLNTSQQLRQILTAFENDFVDNTQLINAEREKVLQRSIRVITIAAVIGAILVIVFSIIILRDSWRSQRYKKQIEASNEHNKSLLKSREQLISMVSHDLRTPLSTIVGYTQLLKDSFLSEKESHYTDRIKNASKYVSQLVEDLLDFSKLEAGRIKIEKIIFNLHTLVKETAENIQSLYPDKPIELIIDIDPNIDQPIVGDAFRIKQILSNLVSNAYKFTQQGSITIRARIRQNSQKENILTLSVIDTGIGIEKKKQSIIFEEFTQADNDTEKKYGGSGLGLTISKKLANLLGANLFLESKPGKGSTFSLSFPAIYSNQKLQDPAKENQHNNIAHNAIVIDDDLALLHLNKEILERNNIKVHPFSSGKEALENINAISYDFIITDIQLPSFNGFFFAETLRSEKKYEYQGQPIIAVTGRKDLDKRSYIEAGFAGFLFKPYHPDQLLQTIDQVLDQKSSLETEEETPKQSPENKEHQLFNLSALTSFLEDESAVKKVLEVFTENTHKDMRALKKAIDKKDYKTVRDLGHKMQTMFKQIDAQTVVPLLHFMEHFKDDQSPLVLENYQVLKRNIKITFQALDAHLKN
ncbi:hybrid sensor histidine kinase/response regulator [Galbibacter sp.]|uniref:hybrid sensor histidine kinase/response regulator n=1 Tax=Galbibacter sp. TaxID=2918471 RepID=UPI003A8DB9A3